LASATHFQGRVFAEGNTELTSNPKQVAIASLSLTVTNPPTQAEVQAIADKVDTILAALRSANIINS